MSDLAREQAERLLAALQRVMELYPEDAGATLPEGIDTGQWCPGAQSQQSDDGDAGGRR
ncbi:hypothetical protein [Mycobacterium haemophilum]